MESRALTSAAFPLIVSKPGTIGLADDGIRAEHLCSELRARLHAAGSERERERADQPRAAVQFSGPNAKRLVDSGDVVFVELGEILPEFQHEVCVVRVRFFGHAVVTPPATTTAKAKASKTQEPPTLLADVDRVAYFVKRALLVRSSDGKSWTVLQEDALDRVHPAHVDSPEITAGHAQSLGARLPAVVEGKNVVPWQWSITVESIDV